MLPKLLELLRGFLEIIGLQGVANRKIWAFAKTSTRDLGAQIKAASLDSRRSGEGEEEGGLGQQTQTISSSSNAETLEKLGGLREAIEGMRATLLTIKDKRSTFTSYCLSGSMNAVYFFKINKCNDNKSNKNNNHYHYNENGKFNDISRGTVEYIFSSLFVVSSAVSDVYYGSYTNSRLHYQAGFSGLYISRETLLFIQKCL